MPRLYFRSIFFGLLPPFMMIMTALTAMLWLTQTLRMLDMVASKGIPLSLILWLSLLLLPSLLFIIMPAALFIAALYVYYRMAIDHEIFVWRSAGLSNRQLAMPAMLLAGLAVMLAYWIAMSISPHAYHKFKEQQAFVRNHYASMLLQDNTFNSPIAGLTVFIRSHQETGLLEGIMINDSRTPGKDVTLTAQTGKIEQKEGHTVFSLQDGTRQEFDNKTKRLQMLYFDNYPMDISLYTTKINERKMMPEELLLPALLKANHKEEEPARKAKLNAEIHQRLSWPWYNLVLSVIAAVTLLHMPYNRSGYLLYISLVGVVGIMALLGGIFAHSLVIANPAIWPVIYGLLLAICLAVKLFSTQRKFRRG